MTAPILLTHSFEYSATDQTVTMTTTRRSALVTFVLSGVLLGILAGCGASSPYLDKAKEAVDKNQYEQALANIDTALAKKDPALRAKAFDKRAQVLRQMADSTMAYEEYKDLYRQAHVAEDSAIQEDPGLRSEIDAKRSLTYTQQVQQGAKMFRKAQRTSDSSSFRRAAAHFGAASSTQPDSASVIFNEAVALLNMEQMKQGGTMNNAVPVLEEYIEKAKNPDKNAYNILSSLYMRNEQMGEAISLLEEARKDLNNRPTYFRISGSSRLGYSGTVEAGGSSRDVDGTVPDRVNIDSDGGTVSGTFEKKQKKGQLRVQLFYKGGVVQDTLSKSGVGDPVSLTADLSEATPLAELQGRLLNAYNRSGQTEKAMKEYRKQIEANPENVTYRYNYGTMLLQAERYDDAIEQFEKAVEIEPGNVKAQYNLGAAYSNKGKQVQDSIRSVEDSLASIRDAAMEENREPTEEEKQTVNMLDQRSRELEKRKRKIFEDAIPPLEQARQLADTGDSLRKDACVALVTAYIQTEQIRKAKQVEDCAGMELQQGGQSQGGN